MKYIIYLSLIFLIWSNLVFSQVSKVNLPLPFETYTEWPDQNIDGCTCVYYKNEQDSKTTTNYLFVADVTYSYGYLKLNGNLEKFDLINRETNDMYIILKNSKYTLRIDIIQTKSLGQESETSKLIGTLTLTDSKGSKIKTNFVGFIGC